MDGIVIAAGGTGGHVYPAIAVARAISELDSAVMVHFAGSSAGPEARLVPLEGYPFTAVASGPWRRQHPWSLLGGIVRSARGAVQAGRLFRAVNVRAVFSTGGYASAPVLLAAASCRVPTVLHEPNWMPGMVTRMFGRVAKRVTVGFPEAMKYFPSSRATVTGVPVRSGLLRQDRAQARRALGFHEPATIVLVLGGSQGARAINRAIADALPHLASKTVPVALVWVCGAREFKTWEPVVAQARLPVKLAGYLEDIAVPITGADIVVGRSGASTVAELLALGKPSVLVPFPHATANHQMHNAAALAGKGAAILLPESQLTGARLAEEIMRLAADPFRRAEMSRRAQAEGRPGAARAVAEEVLAVMRPS